MALKAENILYFIQTVITPLRQYFPPPVFTAIISSAMKEGWNNSSPSSR